MPAQQEVYQRLMDAVEGDISAFTPSLHLVAVHKGHRVVDLSLGKSYKYYDWASLTKIVFAASASMRLYELGLLDFNEPVSDILEFWPHRQTLVKDLVTHSARVEWWRPYYKKLHRLNGLDHKRDALAKLLSQEPLTRARKSKYSDVGMLLYSLVLEEVSGCSLLELWQELQSRVGLNRTHFSVANKPAYSRKFYAPTEACPWRKKILRGEVHDDNTWSLSGVSTHAGLFGPMSDLVSWGLQLRKAYRSLAGSDLAAHKTVKFFTKRAIPKSKGDWALFFMKPTSGASSCGRHFSPSSFGHTGFTGTSFWYDPGKDLMVLILSNRVYPSRDNNKFVSLRPMLHDIVCASL